MAVLIIGSIALDDITTPHGELENGLGGSAVYASIAASYFCQPSLVGVVGEDFCEEHIELLKSKNIVVDGLEKQKGKTFHWKGYYEGDMNVAHTVDTQLNVFGEFNPCIPDSLKDSQYVFLANIDPVLQLKVLEQLKQPKFIMLDTMNFWIEQKKNELLEVIAKIDMVVVNDAEARQLTGESNLLNAAKWIQQLGPRGVMIKKGEHGAMIFWEDQKAVVPAVPLENVVDPTGAGDTYAGAFIGALSRLDDLSIDKIHQAAALGTILASFVVQGFSVNQSAHLNNKMINERFSNYLKLVNIHELDEVFK